MFPVSKLLFPDHGVFRVWWSERRLLSLDLFPQNGLARSGGNETEERGRWIERSAAKFGVGLQRDKEGVVCQKVEREGSRRIQYQRIREVETHHEVQGTAFSPPFRLYP